MQPSGSETLNLYLDGFQEAQLEKKELSQTTQFTCTINQIKEKGIRKQNIKSAPWAWARQVPKNDTKKTPSSIQGQKSFVVCTHASKFIFFSKFFCFEHIKVKYFHTC